MIPVLEEATRGNSEFSAHGVLGYCHYYGVGVETNKKKAKELFRKGCDAGDGMSMYAMGIVNYEKGRYDTAVTLFTKAAKLGNSGGSFWLGLCYWFGSGVSSDENKCIQLSSEAAEAGNEEAETMLAVYSRLGVGMGRDKRKEKAALERSCARGNALATMMLAERIKEGIGKSFVSKTRAIWKKGGKGNEKSNAKQMREESTKQLRALARKRGFDGPVDWMKILWGQACEGWREV